MESQDGTLDFGTVVHTNRADGTALVLLVCEHASNRIPEYLGDMGLASETLSSHIAWDPGALGVAQHMSELLQSPLVHGGVSRLVYDCNRPPEAAGAMPVKSEHYDIPANIAMTPDERQARIKNIYIPFSTAVSDQIKKHRPSLKLMVTVHSFTPVYHGRQRDVELGILHGRDDRFATAMMATVPDDLPFVTRLNEPYSAADGVAHTLDAQALPNGLPNVMIEVRNDLIRTPDQQRVMAEHLVSWITHTLAGFQDRGAA
ncbi:N-formylglutamate amidohydrolase [Ruegeria profundi]|uniref:N-formylglutamate amidohydrolase n=1 Tax=Ruegeria profundi TaxID=1685378 RepID=UPI001CD46609|nr:N-formylglutamate amidohydrolase [Ruegeria profundi]MCA0927531.1 N-formylglutamate amidohydrolase [Ruegeria profundi]